MFARAALALALLLAAPAGALAQPELPEGLNGGDAAADDGGPALPEGLDGGGTSSDSGPALPEGLDGGTAGDTAAPDDTTEPEPEGPFADWRLGGYVDTRIAPRVGDPVDQERFALAETRAELKAVRSWTDVTATLRGHLVADAVAEQHSPHLQQGKGALDLREANLLWRATDFLDIKAGRQILTWGTGDFLFLNDLFPKDYRSFFIGRRDTMLKAPSDAVKASAYSDIANLDLVYTPQFDSDRFIDGDRLSYFNPFAGRVLGDSRTLDTRTPDDLFADDEIAARLYRTFGRYEVALYGYDGFWKSPNALLPARQEATFAPLRVWGASVRGPLPELGGIASAEVAYYDSTDDRAGTDPTVPNSETRLLLGYDRELAANLSAGVQYQRQDRLDHDAYLSTLPANAPVQDQTRELWTLKLTRSWPEEQVTATLFGFWSPTSQDGYLRPRISWSPDDSWTLEAGANLLFGADDHTRFGQLADNSNVFVAARFGF